MSYTPNEVRDHIAWTLGMCEETRDMLEAFAEMLEDADIKEQMQEYEAALPPHQRDGYAEMMNERADIERKRQREEGK